MSTNRYTHFKSRDPNKNKLPLMELEEFYSREMEEHILSDAHDYRYSTKADLDALRVRVEEVAGVNESGEVINARGTYPDLKTRLDSKEAQHDSDITNLSNRVTTAESINNNLSTRMSTAESKLNVVAMDTVERTIYFSPTGNDSNNGTNASTPKRNIQTYINSLPKFRTSRTQLILLPGDYSSQGWIEIANFYGRGDIALSGQNGTKANFIVSHVKVFGCQSVILIENMTANTTTSHGYEIDKSKYVFVSNSDAQATAGLYHGIRVSASSVAVNGCSFSNKRYGIISENLSHVFSNANYGTNNEIGLYATSGSTIVKGSSAQIGGTTLEYGNYGGVVR